MSQGRKAMHGRRPAMASTEKVKDFKGTLKKLMVNLKEYKISLIIVFIFAICSTVFAIIGPKILGNATTELFNGIIGKLSGQAGIDFHKIGVILLTLLGLYLISMVFSYIQGFIMTGISQKFTYKLRKQIVSKVNKLPMSYFDKKTTGEILSIMTNDTDTLNMGLTQSATQLVTSIVTIIGILVMMFSINVPMTFISILILPIAAILMGIIVKKSQKHFINQQDYLASVNGYVEEIYSGYNVVKVFNAEEKMLTLFNEENEKLYNSAWKSQFLSGLMHPIMNFISNIGYVAVAILGGYFAIKGKITVGNIQSFIQYNRQFTQPIGQLSQVSTMVQSMMAASERIFEFLEEEENVELSKKHLKIDNVKGEVEFKNVEFGYNPDNIIIHNFNLKVSPGQKIAIVGPTGAGKTTLVKLLMRFYNINGGEILLDGKNINDFDGEHYRELFGMVLQDTWLFSGTIMENLRYGKLSASDDEVIDAAKMAHVHHFIQTLPDAYNMELNEDTNNISQGQKQLLTIARAILADPKVMILDEATSSVDTRTEILIQKAMDKLMEGRTSFIIAHRLSTIKNADIIIVMDQGNVVETGNHEQLMAKNGFYAKLYNSQFDK